MCRREENPTKCSLSYLNCGDSEIWERNIWINGTKVFQSCDPSQDITFKFGIFEKAVTKQVVSSSFARKYFYCLWWGLQNLRYCYSVVFISLTTILSMFLIEKLDVICYQVSITLLVTS